MGKKKKRKKRKNNKPQRKTMKRVARIPLAEKWLKAHKGKKLINSYSNRFRVDKVCAIIELRMLGVEISKEREAEIRRGIADLAQQKAVRRTPWLNDGDSGIESNEYFAYIVGYTSGGAAYGVTHEEMEEMMQMEKFERMVRIEGSCHTDDLPF